MNQPELHSPNRDSNLEYWAGGALAIGALGVVVASLFYALSPPEAALPTPQFAPAVTLKGMVAGRDSLIAAGIIGVFADVILAVGSGLLMVFRRSASPALEKLGWGFLCSSVLIFVGVDSLSAGVLTHTAIFADAINLFTGFKLLFDTLFVVGTIVFAVGAPLVLSAELKSPAPVLARPLIWLGNLAAAGGFFAGVMYFLGIGMPQVLGASIALGSAIFAIYGLRIAQHAQRH